MCIVLSYRKDNIFMQRRLLQSFTYIGIVANKINQLNIKRHALAGIAYSACTIPPLRHFLRPRPILVLIWKFWQEQDQKTIYWQAKSSILETKTKSLAEHICSCCTECTQKRRSILDIKLGTPITYVYSIDTICQGTEINWPNQTHQTKSINQSINWISKIRFFKQNVWNVKNQMYWTTYTEPNPFNQTYKSRFTWQILPNQI